MTIAFNPIESYSHVWHIVDKVHGEGWTMDPKIPDSNIIYTGESHPKFKMDTCEWCNNINGKWTEGWKESKNGDVEVNDPVDHPIHYTTGKVETIDAIESALGKDGFESYCVGNAIKYLSRYKHKGGYEDVRKAIWYLNRMLEVCDNET